MTSQSMALRSSHSPFWRIHTATIYWDPNGQSHEIVLRQLQPLYYSLMGRWSHIVIYLGGFYFWSSLWAQKGHQLHNFQETWKVHDITQLSVQPSIVSEASLRSIDIMYNIWDAWSYIICFKNYNYTLWKVYIWWSLSCPKIASSFS